MPGPIQSTSSSSVNASYLESPEVEGGQLMCTAPPAAAGGSAPSSGAQSTAQLVSAHDAAQRDCTKELVKMGVSGLAVAGSSAAMVAATPTVVGVLPSIIGFIGASASLGAATAEYLSCREGVGR